jgi:hypothetical protein
VASDDIKNKIANALKMNHNKIIKHATENILPAVKADIEELDKIEKEIIQIKLDVSLSAEAKEKKLLGLKAKAVELNEKIVKNLEINDKLNSPL